MLDEDDFVVSKIVFNKTIIDLDITVNGKVSNISYAGTKLEKILRDCIKNSSERQKYMNLSYSVKINSVSGKRYVIGKMMYVDATGATLTFIFPYINELYVLFASYGNWNFIYSTKTIYLN